jgi:drug/metabolite transporter (DMT)-like permease
MASSANPTATLPLRHGSRASGIALMLAAAVLWSLGGVGIKSLPLPPLAVSGWRGAFALPVLVAMLALRMRAAGPAAWRPMRGAPAWIGAAAYSVMMTSFVAATKLTTAASAIFLQYTSPVYVALLSWPLLRERVTWRDAAACAGVLAGMLLFFGDALTPGARLGNALGVLSGFGAAALPLALRADQGALARAGALQAASVSPAFAIAAGDAMGVLACVPAMVASPPQGAAQWALVAALGTMQIGLPYVLYALAVPRLTALESSLVPALEPVLNPVWVLLAVGERPGALSLAGAAFVLASVLLPALRG